MNISYAWFDLVSFIIIKLLEKVISSGVVVVWKFLFDLAWLGVAVMVICDIRSHCNLGY